MKPIALSLVWTTLPEESTDEARPKNVVRRFYSYVCYTKGCSFRP